jgi:hypothetical protein
VKIWGGKFARNFLAGIPSQLRIANQEAFDLIGSKRERTYISQESADVCELRSRASQKGELNNGLIKMRRRYKALVSLVRKERKLRELSNCKQMDFLTQTNLATSTYRIIF